MKYTVTKDFTASQFFFDRPSPNQQAKDYKKGETIEAAMQIDFGNNQRLVSDDGFNIPQDSVIPATETVKSNSPGKEPLTKGINLRSIFTLKNLTIGLAVYGGASLLFKLTKSNS